MNMPSEIKNVYLAENYLESCKKVQLITRIWTNSKWEI